MLDRIQSNRCRHTNCNNLIVMLNKIIDIGGEERPLNFGRNAHADLEQLTGISVLEKFKASLISPASFTYIRAMAYVGLKWGLYDSTKGTEPKPKFTLFQVGDWLENDDLGPDGPMGKIVDFFKESMPKSKNAGAEASTPLNGQTSTVAL